MKKTFAILAGLLALAACTGAPEDPVREAIDKAIKAELADPSSYVFVALERVEDYTVDLEARRAALLVPLASLDDPVHDAKVAQILEAAATMPADSIVGALYDVSFRADIPGKGRDFPMKVSAIIAEDGHVAGFGDTDTDAIYETPILVPELARILVE